MVHLAREEDLPHLLRVLDQPYFHEYGLNPEKAFRLLKRALSEGELFLTGNPPQALAWFYPQGGFGQGYLRLLAVAERAQGQGLGTLLVQHLLERGLRFTLVERENVQAVTFYRRFGFQEAGLLPGFVRPDKTEVILWRL
ncbi:MAG: GNAT family N-acetyltransferase [Thermus sp.]